MTTPSPARAPHVLPKYTAWLAWLFVALCVGGGAYGAVFFASDTQPILGAAILFSGAALVSGGIIAARRNSPWLAVALVTAGALVVGVPFFWTILATVMAIALIVLFVLDARRASSVAARPAAS